jgi:hypothetical protein
MAGKKKPKKTSGRRPKPGRTAIQAASTTSMAMQNLINMVAVMAVSGAVLLGLLTAKYF